MLSPKDVVKSFKYFSSPQKKKTAGLFSKSHWVNPENGLCLTKQWVETNQHFVSKKPSSFQSVETKPELFCLWDYLCYIMRVNEVWW